MAFYSDKHATFWINKAGAPGGAGMTQFGRALHQLNIDIICANAPQAKGRIERANGTLQDRLVRELRLIGIAWHGWRLDIMDVSGRTLLSIPLDPTVH